MLAVSLPASALANRLKVQQHQAGPPSISTNRHVTNPTRSMQDPSRMPAIEHPL